jgi:hypothetical protein
VKALLVVVMLGLCVQAFAQDAEKKPKAKPKRSPAASEQAHRQPTKDQIRKFNELEKKEEQQQKKAAK